MKRKLKALECVPITLSRDESYTQLQAGAWAVFEYVPDGTVRVIFRKWKYARAILSDPMGWQVNTCVRLVAKGKKPHDCLVLQASLNTVKDTLNQVAPGITEVLFKKPKTSISVQDFLLLTKYKKV